MIFWDFAPGGGVFQAMRLIWCPDPSSTAGGRQLRPLTALNGWEHTGEDVAGFQFIVGDDHANNADPADGVVQVEPEILSLEAGTVVEGGVDVL